MLKIDTHFHANVAYLPKSTARKKAMRLVPSINHLDILCSTEHGYKNPLAAYDFLVEAKKEFNGSFEILPGVENISKEGVELIFVTSSRELLIDLLHEIPPFEWSIYDFDKISKVDAITIVPHLFSPSKTGFVTSMGLRRALEEMRQYDFVETTNGSFLSPALRLLPNISFRQKMEATAYMPEEYRFEGLRSSIGTDAHKVGDINCYGTMKHLGKSLSAYQQLEYSSGMQLCKIDVAKNHLVNIAGTLAITAAEALHKKKIKLS